MKKFFLLTALAVFGLTANAQDEADHGAIHKGQWIIEINTGSWTTGMTGFSLASSDGDTQWSAGAEVGYFIMDNLAIKAGLGYQDYGDFDLTAFNYKIGAKYYIMSKIPVGLDFTGTSYKDADENPSYFGIEGGYAFFISDHVSIEPKLRYNVSLNSDFYDDAFQALVGFAFHF